MPILRVAMHPGRTLEQKRAYVSELTRVTIEVFQCPPENVEVLLQEVPRDLWAKSGVLKSES